MFYDDQQLIKSSLIENLDIKNGETKDISRLENNIFEFEKQLKDLHDIVYDTQERDERDDSNTSKQFKIYEDIKKLAMTVP